MRPDQLTSRGEQSLSIFLLAKDVFHKSETETPSNYNAWFQPESLGQSSWPVTHICSVPSLQDLSLGAVMTLTKMEIIYGGMQSMSGKWAGIFMSLKRQRT